MLRAELEALLGRLNSQIITRMHQERDAQRRGLILDFPHQLSEIAAQLCVFSDMTFTGNRYQRASPLRGVYLTSAPHVMASPATQNPEADIVESAQKPVALPVK